MQELDSQREEGAYFRGYGNSKTKSRKKIMIHHGHISYKNISKFLILLLLVSMPSALRVSI